MARWTSLLLTPLLAIVSIMGCGGITENVQQRQSRLDIVKKRGTSICGVSGTLPGFSFVDESGKYSGIDVEVCRAVAAALFDNPDAVEYRNLEASERFTALNGGEVDVLSRNTTWTLGRDSLVGMEFAPTTFYDGQGMMVRKDSKIGSLQDLQGASICVGTGTTTELNLTDTMRQAKVNFTPIAYQQADATFGAYLEGRCEGVTADKSALVARRSNFPNPQEHIILDITMSKEPLGPATINNDSAWFDVVKWVTYALIEAEELGITSANVEQMKKSDNPTIRRFLGVEGALGEGLGLSNDFTARIVKHVGNYGEVYDRNLGKNSQIKLPRGENDLWTRGGLLYSPPFR
ncbi:MAG: amino acid ABC transporter substrate-binding protein [Hormoscilla sp. GUM202]|nr:amino acid ABC transporter substrate-binding protein [Hormoscilla sp. GUM202]